MKLTKNFTLEEFKCHDGTYPEGLALKNIKEVAANLQVLRDHLKKPIIVNSGYRTVAYNAKVGGVKTSQHTIGRAADIRVSGMTPNQVADAIVSLIDSGKMKQGGIGIYGTFVHYDVRGYKARWID